MLFKHPIYVFLYKQVQHQQSNTWQYLNHLESVSKNDWTCSNVLYLSSPIPSSNMCVGKPPLLAEGPPVGGPFERQKSPNLSLAESKFQQKTRGVLWSSWSDGIFHPSPKKQVVSKTCCQICFTCMAICSFVLLEKQVTYYLCGWMSVWYSIHGASTYGVVV